MLFLILLAVGINIGVFVAYPVSGTMGFTFLYISGLLWTAFAVFLGRATSQSNIWARIALSIVFAFLCAFSSLSFLPQTDRITALTKFSDGKYPDKRTLYLGLLRLGVDYPALLPPAAPEKPI